MKTLLCLCLLLFAFCFTKQNDNYFFRFANDNLDSLSLLKNDKVVIDKRMISDEKSLLLFAKAKSKINLIAIKNSKNAKWPDDIQCSYNVLKDTDNNVIMILKGPYSESGDWDISYVHYFDKNGKTFAFTRETGFFNSECTVGAAHEYISKYYNHNFKQIAQTYRLTDSKNKPLNKSKCVFNYDFKDYQIYPDVNACLKAYNIKL